MVIIDPVAGKDVVPRSGLDVLAPVFVPLDIRFLAEDAGPFPADIGHREKRADVETHAVIEIRVPADRLSLDRLPTDEDVVGTLPRQDQFEPLLQALGGGQPVGCPIHPVADVALLARNPVAEVGVDQRLQCFVVEFVVVDQGREAILEPIPDVPDEGAVVEELAVLEKELLAEPGVEGSAGVVNAVEQFGERVVRPGLAIGGGQQVEQAIGRRRLSPYRREADDAVRVGIAGQALAARDPFALLVGQLHLRVEFGRPAVPEEAGDGDLQHARVVAQPAVSRPLLLLIPDDRTTGVAVEDPLGGIVAVGHGKSVGIFLLGDFGPTFQVEGDFDQGFIRNF